MIFNRLRNRLSAKSGIAYALIIDNKLVTTEEKNNEYIKVAYTPDGLKFGKTVSGSDDIVAIPDAVERIKAMLSITEVAGLDLGNTLKVEDYDVHVCHDLRTVIINTAALTKVVRVMNTFDRSSGVRMVKNGSEITQYDAETFFRIYVKIVSDLYERFREGAMNYLIRRILYSSDLKNRAVVSIIRVKHVFVPTFFRVTGIHQPSDFKLVKDVLKETRIYQTTEEIGETFEISDGEISLLTHKEVCQAFGLNQYMQFNTMLIHDMIYSEMLGETPTQFDRWGGGVYLLYGKARSPEKPLIKYEPDDDYVEVSQFAVRLATNRDYANKVYNILNYIQEYTL